MLYYHVYVAYVDRKGETKSLIVYDMDEQFVRDTITTPFLKNIRFFCLGEIIRPSKVENISIFYSERKYRELILPNKKSPINEENLEWIRYYFYNEKVNGVVPCTPHFITSPPQEKEEPKKTVESFGTKKKVFIVHGRDEKHALRLQKYLTRTLKVDAEMFEDFKEKSGSNTIIEQLEYIKENVGYAFVIVTPDDLGCLREEMEKLKNKVFLGKESLKVEKICKVLDTLKTRARQNVVFEHGLFIGALGRNRVCCLLQQDTKEKPSDTDGILYVSFNKSVKDKFAEIRKKLKKVG